MKTAGYACLIAGVLWLGYVYVGYPVLLALLAIIRRVRHRLEREHTPAISVLISARNEEQDIQWKVAETLSLDYPREQVQVLVASDASDDGTDRILESIDDPRLQTFRMEQRGGKARALNELVKHATGELLFFTDANAHVKPDSLRQMARHFADPRVGCVTGDSFAIPQDEGAAIAQGASIYWAYESTIRALESRLGSVLVCDGAIFCIRRDLYTSVSPELANDLELPILIGARRYWVLHEPAAVVWEHETTSQAEEFARRRRICAQGALAMIRLRKSIRGFRAWQFVSHKALRWLSLVPMSLFLIGSILLSSMPLFGVTLAAQCAFYILAAAGWRLHRTGRTPGRHFSVPFYVVMGGYGALVGIIDACRGRRFDIWDIPTQSRGEAGGIRKDPNAMSPALLEKGSAQ
jgi:cellulose synthase/poly-beta-1,6-N-acetylglucosamine synthase-like glycosyltransferase